MRNLLLILALLCAPAHAQQFAVTALGDQPFRSVQIGGGGWIVGIDINPTDGTKLARTDTYGAYKWNGTSWDQLVTESTMPAANFGFYPPNTSANQVFWGGFGIGVYEITSAPSNSSIIYMAFPGGPAVVPPNGSKQQGHIYKSTNGGTTFANTHFDQDCLTDCYMLANGIVARENGRKMAVSYANPNWLIVCTQSQGCWATADGGSTFAQISTGQLPVETEYAVAFDPSDPTGKTAYVCAATSGVYVSTNADQGGSSTWTLTTSGPTTCQHMVTAARTGVVFVVDGVGGSNGSLWKYASGTWTHNPGTPGTLWHSVAVDPSACATIGACHVVLGGPSGTLTAGSTDDGGTWTTAATATRSCTGDVAWMCTANEFFMSNGDMIFDPTGGGLNFGEGIGFWTGTPNYSGGAVTWNAKSMGIEQLVTFGQVIAPNGYPVLGVEDRGITAITNPYNYLTNGGLFTLTQAFNLTSSGAVDYVANNPCFMVAQMGPDSGTTFDWSATSSDCGATWIPFNNWNATVAASALANNGSGLVRVTVPSTAGLTTWAAGAGSIATVLQQNQTVGSLAGNLTTKSFQVTVIDATHFDLQHSAFSSNNALATAGNYLIYVPTRPSSAFNGFFLVQAVANSGGAFQLTVNTGSPPAPAAGVVVNVTGTTCCDGWWILTGSSGVTTILQDSTFSASPAWSGAGVLGGITATSGGIAAASPTNFIRVPENDNYPFCTTDGGKTWTEIGATATGTPHYGTLSSASWAGNVVTFVANTAVNIQFAGSADDKTFFVTGASPSGYNGTFTATGNGGDVTGKTVTAALVGDPGAFTSGGTLIPGGPSGHGTGWGTSAFLNQHVVAADRVTPNTFYMYNYNVAAIYRVTNCTPTQVAGSKVTPGTSYAAVSNNNSSLQTVPGNSGHLFFTAGESGSAGQSHPANTGLWRSCNGSSNMQQVTGIYEPWTFGFGAIKPGHTYPSIYVVGWQSSTPSRNDAVFGVWESDNDPNAGVGGIGSGSTCDLTQNTWTKLTTWPIGWQAGPQSITGSRIPGQVFIGNGNGFVGGVFN
jgi:hypothetical protein